MPPQLKRSVPWSDTHQNEFDEDYSPYTKVRRIMQNGNYEDEIEMLRLRNSQLESRVNELEGDLETILNQEMDDIISLKEDVHLYYRQYREARLEVMELEEVILELRDSGVGNQSVPQQSSDELISLQDEVAHLEKRRVVANAGQLNEDIGSKSASLEYPDSSPTLQGENALPIVIHSENNPYSSDSTPPSASILSYPTDAPTSGWFFEAFHYLNVALGPQYLDLLQKWMDYERGMGLVG
ncbi:hypothetical protein HHX47_DHR10000397 [Lentinula edodes]|nr:hypothetical protein HHX47_DHR10000397 [Lentinula edodes]